MKKSLLALACSYALTGCVSSPVLDSTYRSPVEKTQKELDRDNGVIVESIIYEPATKIVPEHEQGPSFLVQEVLWSYYDGKNTLLGNVEYFPTLRGESATCAGKTVIAVPQSRYATHRMFQVYESASGGEAINIPLKADPEYVKYVKFAQCNDQNEFTFWKLATGTYYIITGVYWEDQGQQYKTGFMKRVFVSNNGINFVVLHP